MDEIKTPLIHIGLHKTGTTWLQDNLFKHESYGFSTVDGKHPANFAWRFIYGGKRGQPSALKFDGDATRRDYTEMTRSSIFPIVISNEDLCSHMFSGGVGIETIARRLRSVFTNAKILMTVREQRAAIRSCYEDMLEGGGVCGIRRFMRSGNDNQLPMFSLGYFKYDEIAKLYQNVFGASNLLVLPYEQLLRDPERFLTQIYTHAQVRPEHLEPLIAATEKRSNAHRAAKAASLYFLRGLNLLGNPTNNNAKIGLGLPALPKTAVYYTQRYMPGRIARSYRRRIENYISEYVGEFYRESNINLQSMVDWNLDKEGYLV
jgi:hypothetical protein